MADGRRRHRAGGARRVASAPPEGAALRALLVMNPNATTTDDRVADTIARAIAVRHDLEVQATKQRGHATHLVAGAVHEGVEVVFALGGDGTANEVLQALAGTEVILAPIPGGGTNVLARALGLPNEPRAATRMVLDNLATGRTRRISLGRAGERYFGFNAGFGFDASVVRLVERRVRLKRAVRQLSFVWCALQEWFGNGGRADNPISVRLGTGPVAGLFSIAIVANTDPYTYLGPRPFRVTPGAAFDRGLDLLAIEEVGTTALLTIIRDAFWRAGHTSRSGVTYLPDLEGLTMSSPRPHPLMVDGEYAGEHTEVVFRSEPDALRVAA